MPWWWFEAAAEDGGLLLLDDFAAGDGAGFFELFQGECDEPNGD